MTQPVMILAGGTGGHVFPALAVANKLRANGVPVIWVGTEAGIEYRVVPQSGFELVTMNIQGLRGKGLIHLLKAPLIILAALHEAYMILRQYRPSVLLGMGGFVTGPCGLMAVLMRKPLILHEQNAIMGLTNRILAPFSNKIFAGFSYSSKKIEHCGNPVRSELLNVEEPKQRFAKKSDSSKHFLIIGGSQGAKTLNTIVPQAMQLLGEKYEIEVFHQTGKQDYDVVKQGYESVKASVRVEEFIEDMQAAYAWADLIICRSGAMTLAEIASIGLGAVLVPYPYAVDDHQTVNARQFVEHGAAYHLPEQQLNQSSLAKLCEQIITDDNFLIMADKARALASIDAAQRVADECMLLGRIHQSQEVS